MPEKCRVGVCGFDPMLVKGYVKTGFRGLWWHISDELCEEYNVKPGDKISGKILAVYRGKTAEKTDEPNEAFDWKVSKESGLAVLLPPEAIVKYKLTEFDFLELIVEKHNDKEVFPGEERESVKMWPLDKMKLHFTLDFIAP
ncbi:MAG: hypothetical protein ACLFVT_07530 [Syntrophobacteria bacterium]